MKNKMFVLGVAVVAVLGFFLLKNKPVAPTAPSSPAQSSGASEDFIRSHSPSFGNSMAKVTVVEWFDPECEACRAVHPIFARIVAEYKDRVHFVHRYMPYHRNSMFAACALEEVKELGKYEEALDVLFENQPQWGDHHQPKPDLIPELLAKIGIPKEKLEKDYLIQKHSEKIKIDEADGKKVGVRGTPTFFINGQMLQELGEAPLRMAIEEALK